MHHGPRPIRKRDGLKRKRWRLAGEQLGTDGADERKGERLSWLNTLVVFSGPEGQRRGVRL